MHDKTYTFTVSRFYRFPQLTVKCGSKSTDHEVRPALYDRFVALANSGRYHVEILDADHGVAWQMRRKAA